jgi:O-antigen/teichoic acid export membrane protein
MAWVKKIIGYGGYIFGSGAVAAIYQNLDQLMISWFGPVAVAPYGVAYRINGMVDVPSFAAADILFPKASLASVEEGPQKIKYLYERMVAILLSFTIPMALFIILFPKLVIFIVAGSGYYEAVPILQLYMIAGILRPAQNQAANLLNSIGKPKLCFYINLGYLIVNLSLNLVCILYIDRFYGAAIGTVAAFMLGAMFWYFVMKKQIGLELGNVIEHGKDVYKMAYEMATNALRKKQAREVG